MNKADYDGFVALLTTTAKLYQRELHQDVIVMYWRALEPFDIQAVREAFNRHVQNPDAGQFWPKIADLMRMIGGSTQDRAFVAWAQVERAMRTVGGHRSVVFEDAITMRVIEDMGGWPRLCETLVDDLPFRSREFEHAYRGFAARGPVPDHHPTHLPGRAEIANGDQFKDWEPKLALIGDPEKCRAVHASGCAQPVQVTLDMALPVVAPRVLPAKAPDPEGDVEVGDGVECI